MNASNTRRFELTLNLGEQVVTWYFVAPEFVYRQHAVTRLTELGWKSASTVTVSNMPDPGFVDRVKEQLPQMGIGNGVFDRVESDPSLQTATTDSETWSKEGKNGNHVWVG